MIVQHTYSLPVVWEPDLEGVVAKQIASSGREVTALKLSSGAGAAFISLYDSNMGAADLTHKRWVLDASTEDNDAQIFTSPIVFKKGIYAVLEQGTGNNPKLCIAIINDQV